MTKEYVANREETIEALLEASGRAVLPLSYRFVQHRDADDKPLPGPLARFVSAHNERTLHLYFLGHAVASAGDFEVTRNSKMWARAMGLAADKESSRAAISKGWAWLERHQLIARARRGRLAQITLLNDDGSGRPYIHPFDEEKPYLALPYEFWRDGWHEKLDLASIAVLLIGMTLKPNFILPQSQVRSWYGISAATLSKGINGLHKHDLIKRTRTPEKAPLAPDGFRFVYRYTMLAPFHRRPPKNKKLGEPA